MEESDLNISVFDEDGHFRAQGGSKKINKVFGDKLEGICVGAQRISVRLRRKYSMIYDEYPYTIFNQNYINPNHFQQIQRNKFWDQHKKIDDMVKAISDYCEAARGIEEEYR